MSGYSAPMRGARRTRRQTSTCWFKGHQGVLTLFNQHLVRAGHFEALAARVLARLQKYREQADYGESFVVDLEGVQEEAAAARQFVERADQFAQQSLSGQP